MKTLSISIILIFSSILSFSQDIAGKWNGLLKIQNTQLRIVFNINKTDSGYSATMDSPDQNAKGLPIDETTFKDNELFLNAKSMGISYKGILNYTVDTINGTFVQGAAKLNLTLTRNKQKKEVIKRPQDPTYFPYYQEDIIFVNKKANIKLAGTLTLPKDKKVENIVILISGSGPQNRDEEVASFNHRPFLVWSDWLTKQGIGVLRYDDRGVGKSTGNFDNSTSADFADDAEAAVDYILGRKDLKNVKIGLMGHSEGGIIAPMVASRNKNVKFVVLLAAPGLPIDQLLLQQIEDNDILEKVPTDISKLNIQTTKKVLAYLKKNKDVKSVGWEFGKENDDAFLKGLKDILITELKKYPSEAIEGTSIDDIVEQQLKTNTGKWFRYFATFIPSDYLEKVTCPVLALNGTLDCQVRCTSNLEAIKKALIKAKNNNFEVVPMEGMNHILQKAKTGAISEYSQIEETINPIALKKVSDWINNLKLN